MPHLQLFRQLARRASVAFVLAAGVLSVAQASTVDRSFNARYTYNGRADAFLVGNSSMNCSGGCAAQNGSGNNNSFTMVHIDVDADATTFNSSSATFTLPAGASVLRAFLYWGADTSAASGGSAAPNPAIRNTVQFATPVGGYSTITATTITDSSAQASRYTAVAEVTPLVTAGGTGAYTVASVQAGTGADRYGGWSLVVIVSDPTAPLRSLTLFDGAATINTAAPSSLTVPVTGFRTPATGAVGARIGLVAFEGDNGFTGDQFRVNGTNLSDGTNPTDNVFNSTHSRLGVLQTGRIPQQSNLLGLDIDYIAVSEGVIANNATSANLTFTTTQDVYFPVALLFQTNVYEPDIITNFTKSAADVNGGQFRPGDEVSYTINLSNTGDDSADVTVISDVLPAGMTYVPGSLEIVSGPNAGVMTDGLGDDQADYNAGTRTVTFRVGTGATASTGGRITPVPQPDSATTVRFSATIDAAQANGTGLSNLAGVTFVGATSGVPGTGTTPPAVITVSRDADLAVTKTGPASVLAGAPISYLVTVSSLGPDSADGATVTDNVPAGITGVTITCSATGGAVCPATGGLTTLSAVVLPTLPSGGSVEFTIAGTAPNTQGSLSNSASVAPPAGTNDPTPGNNTAGPVVTSVNANVDLAVTGALNNVGPVHTGALVSYSFTVANNGPGDATGSPISIPVPPQLAGVSWTCAPAANCSAAAGSGDVSLNGNLANGETLTITITGTAPATTPSTIAAVTGTASAPTGLTDTNPANNSATVPAITVSARLIVATNDSAGPVNGSTGAGNVVNVLTNDTLDGAAATASNVTLTQVSTTNPNVTLNTATGAVSVAAGTAADTYTVAYQICQTSDPTNCAAANASITVSAQPIAANNDTAPAVDGSAGGTPIANVLANDMLGGTAPTPSNVTISVVAPASNANVVLNTATGAVTVAAGTPAGTYAIAYQICEQLNPANCASATATAIVSAQSISAANDTSPAVSGSTGGSAIANVLANDSLGGVAPTTSNVTITVVTPASNPNVVLDTAAGAVSVAPGTPAGSYAITYQICEQLNPANCATATATAVVSAQPILAINDASPQVNGATGGSAVANVLANDSLGGSAPTTANVTITVVTPALNPNVVLNTATGGVTVAAGTPAGSYAIAYQICEQLNPTNCATATATANVGSAAIAASNDAGALGGATGGTAISNVLGNDTLNGSPATTTSVALTQVSSSNPGVALDTSTGAVNVAPGTAAGTYTLTYEICEQLNPTNCTTAIATVTVTSAVLAATDDTGSIGGGSGGTAIANVLVNDTVNGAPATTSNVTLGQVSTSNPNVTLDPTTGRIDAVPGTPAGNYAVTYEICEQLNPTNCTTAVAAVTVTSAVLVAGNDTGTVGGATGGTAISNVLVNDTVDGSPATTSTVSLTQVSTSNPNVTLDPATGRVNVAPGTAAGTYSLVYRMCEQLNPTNCTTATDTVAVTAATLVATPDTGTIVGSTGGPAVPNVLGNDTGNGSPTTLTQVVLTQVSTSNPNVTVDPSTATVNVVPGTSAGTVTLNYQICERLNPANCATTTVTVVVTAAVIDAVDDASPPVNGVVGNPAVLNVLGNDTLGGMPATATTVSLTQVSTSSPFIALDPATGNVAVVPGTPAGTYTLTYGICEQLNQTSCDTATVTVNVVAPTLVAADDTGTTSQNTAVSLAVLGNDTTGGAPGASTAVTVTIVTAPSNGTTTVNTDGTVTYAPANNYSGPDSITYRICDVVNPTVCDDAVVSLTITANTVDAKDETITTPQTGPVVINPMTRTSTGGGAPLDPGSVRVVTMPINGTAVVNPNGTITYTPNATFFGTETFTYQICDLSAPTPICDVATVTIVVAMQTPQLRVSKVVTSRAVKVGDLVRYTVTVENTGISPASDATVIDTPPQGFTFVEGSLSVDDTDDRFGLASANPIRITGIDVPVGGRATVIYLLRVGAGVGRGTHSNQVSVADAIGTSVSNTATADVIVEGDPVTEDSLILGSVFFDRDGDGVQQDGEPGLAGVRLASVEGLLIETDVHGRFHLAGISAENALRGRNFILKVDVATLPPGTTFTTANPLVRRITPGIPVRFDFGVSLPSDDTQAGK